MINLQGSAREKDVQIIINPTITDPLKEISMVKTDPKKVQKQIFILLVPLGTVAQLLTKKISHFTIPVNCFF